MRLWHDREGFGKQVNISDIVEREINRFYQKVRHVSMEELSGSPNELKCAYRPTDNMVFEGLYYVHFHNRGGSRGGALGAEAPPFIFRLYLINMLSIVMKFCLSIII